MVDVAEEVVLRRLTRDVEEAKRELSVCLSWLHALRSDGIRILVLD